MNNHPKLKCTVCEFEIDIDSSHVHGHRVTCPNCFAQLVIRIEDGRKQLRCALCRNPKQLACMDDCERKLNEREKRGFFDVRL